MSEHIFNPTFEQFIDLAKACVSTIHDLTFDIADPVEGCDARFLVTSNPLEYVRIVRYKAGNTQEAADYNARELSDFVRDVFEWANLACW